MPMTAIKHEPQISHKRSRLPRQCALDLKERQWLTPPARSATTNCKPAGGARSLMAMNQRQRPSSLPLPGQCQEFASRLQMLTLLQLLLPEVAAHHRLAIAGHWSDVSAMNVPRSAQ